jgi:hypothetical protein
MANHPNRPKKQWFQLEGPDEAILRALFDLYGSGALMAVLSRFQVTREKQLALRPDKWKSEEAERILRDSRSAVIRIVEDTLKTVGL